MGGISIFMRRRGIQSSPTESNYIRFEDKQVEQICVANFSSDGIGLTPEDAAAVTNIGLIFRNNTTIESFDEFKYFTSVSYIGTGEDASSGGAFAGCTSLKKITLPESLTDIRPFAFYGCTSLESINLENEHITKIGNEAFKSCGKLHVNIDLPNLELLGTRVSADVFQYSGVTSVTSLGKITKIWGYGLSEHGTFLGCSNLTSVVLPPDLTEIGGRVFKDCTALSYIYYNWENLITLEQQSLYNCTSLFFDELNLSSCTTLGVQALYGVKIVKLILTSLEKLPFTSNAQVVNYGDKNTLEEIILSNNVTEIPNHSFANYGKLSKVILNNEVITSIGNYAFYYTNLGAEHIVNYPKLSGELGDRIWFASKVERFENLGNINSIPKTSSGSTFGKDVKFVRLPNTFVTFNGYAFYQCSNLETLIVEATTPPALTSTDFYQASSTFIIYVPDSSVDTYKSTVYWSNFAARIKPLSEYQG